jgi:hypothetical protein
MTDIAARLVRHKFAAEIGLLALMGLFLALIGPFGTIEAPSGIRFAYWLVNIIGGGLIGIAIDGALRRSVPRDWSRVLVVAVSMTPFVTLLVLGASTVILGHRRMFTWSNYVPLLWQVFVIALPVMAVRMVAWRRPERIVEEKTIVVPPLPECEAMFRQRLSAKRRTARLIALEAHDHYLKVHTDAGVELLTLRLSDAVRELGGAYGYQVHRSWWVSASTIEAVQWRRGSGEARLAGGLTVPVSRTYAPILRETGWL